MQCDDQCVLQAKDIKGSTETKDEMEDKGMVPDSYTYTSLILGEFISGNVDEATRLFDEMCSKSLVQNVVRYTAKISGLSKAGQSNESFEFYGEMKKRKGTK